MRNIVFYAEQSLFSAGLRPADQLRHGAHGAVHAPGTGLEEEHGDQAQHGGGKHHAVEAEGELDDARVDRRAVVGPMPGQAEGPEKGDGLLQRGSAGKYRTYS